MATTTSSTGVGEGFESLSSRFSLLETMYISSTSSSSSNSSSHTSTSTTLIQSVQHIASQVTKIEKEYPEFKQCAELLMRVFPLLSKKNNSLKAMQQQVQTLLAQREFIEQQVQVLQSIGGLHQAVNGKEFLNAVELKSHLDKLDLKLEELKPALRKQTNEIDEILQLYEQATLYISKAIESWDIRLKHQNI